MTQAQIDALLIKLDRFPGSHPILSETRAALIDENEKLQAVMRIASRHGWAEDTDLFAFLEVRLRAE